MIAAARNDDLSLAEDRSDDAEVSQMVRSTRLKERAIREIDDLKQKGAWNA